MHELVVWAGCVVGTFLGSALANWLIKRSTLKWERDRLYEWIEAQAPKPSIDPHRTDARKLYGVPRPFEDHREDLMVDRGPGVVVRDNRPEPPPPTSVPGPGRSYEE